MNDDSTRNDHGAFLQPPRYNTRYTTADYDYFLDFDDRHISNNKYRYNASQIIIFGHKFNALADYSRTIAADIRKDGAGNIPILERLFAEGKVQRRGFAGSE